MNAEKQTNPPPPRTAVVWVQRAAALSLFGAVVLVLSEVLTAGPSEASIPVIDMAAIGQMVQQYEQMTQQLETMYRQVALLQDQIQSITGHYGIGTLTGRVNPWGNSSWQDILAMVNQGVNPGDAAAVQAFNQARGQYQQTYPALATGLMPQNPRLSTVYSGDYQSAMTGLSVGQQTFNSVEMHLAEIQTYKDRIEQTDNLKAAVDLNTAVNVKVAQLNAEILRMHAVQLNLMANGQNDTTSGQAAQVEFFTN
jgi:type IV secretion system protein VirB5